MTQQSVSPEFYQEASQGVVTGLVSEVIMLRALLAQANATVAALSADMQDSSS